MIVLGSLLTQDLNAEETTLFSKFCSLFSELVWGKDSCKFIPVQFDDCNIPLIEAEIEGNKCSLMLDLGSYNQIHLSTAILDKVNKKPYGVSKFTDVSGNHYESQRYLIPEIKVRDYIFNEIIVCEENEDFKKNTEIWSPSEGPPTKNDGLIGRALMKRKNVLLDFPRSRIALIERTDSAKKLGFSLENMVMVPFELTAHGIILNIDTDLGKKRFLLDSGFTKSVIKTSQYQYRECQKDDDGYKYFISERFAIEGKDFGNFQLHLLEMGPEMDKIDGVLGMSFMQCHTVYIDFRKKTLFIGDFQQSLKTGL